MGASKCHIQLGFGGKIINRLGLHLRRREISVTVTSFSSYEPTMVHNNLINVAVINLGDDVWTVKAYILLSHLTKRLKQDMSRVLWNMS